ncbi:MAG: hypothetical protein KOO63_07925 [Bacteroidales bacterium]|nr:hypothetical protein [Candidatus Latescibacterota bacterium]
MTLKELAVQTGTELGKSATDTYLTVCLAVAYYMTALVEHGSITDKAKFAKKIASGAKETKAVCQLAMWNSICRVLKATAEDRKNGSALKHSERCKLDTLHGERYASKARNIDNVFTIVLWTMAHNETIASVWKTFSELSASKRFAAYQTAHFGMAQTFKNATVKAEKDAEKAADGETPENTEVDVFDGLTGDALATEVGRQMVALSQKVQISEADFAEVCKAQGVTYA